MSKNIVTEDIEIPQFFVTLGFKVTSDKKRKKKRLLQDSDPFSFLLYRTEEEEVKKIQNKIT